MKKALGTLLFLASLSTLVAHAQTANTSAATAEPYGIALEGYAYPYPVQLLPVIWEGQSLRLAYMDVAPTANPNGRSVVLMHGRNFPGSY